ncbi:hypothetical protein [Dryocola clanedunensis]
MMPYWALGGMATIVSIFLMENMSYSLLEKAQELQIAQVISRSAMIAGGSVDNARLLASAANVDFNALSRNTQASVSEAKIDALDKMNKTQRRDEIYSTAALTSSVKSLPFEEINRSLSLDTRTRSSTADKVVKLVHPLNIIMAVEASPDNYSSVSRAINAFYTAAGREINAGIKMKVSVIPYSYRVNQGGYCYTGIGRGDDFSFQWWEDYYMQQENLNRAQQNLRDAQNSLSYTYRAIENYNEQIKQATKKQQDLDPGSKEYLQLSRQIRNINASLLDANSRIPSLQLTVNNNDYAVKQQARLVEQMEKQPQYKIYLSLSKHYSRAGDNYRLFSDYLDRFSNQGSYSMPETRYYAAANQLTLPPNYYRSLAVQRSRYFGDSTSCPAAQVRTDLTNLSAIRSAVGSIDYAGQYIQTLEGLLWAGRTVFSRNNGNTRNVVMLFVSDKKDTTEPDKLPGVGNTCSGIRSLLANGNVAKLLVITANKNGRKKFERQGCATQWANDTGYIVLDDITKDFSNALQEKFLQAMTQESTSRSAM